MIPSPILQKRSKKICIFLFFGLNIFFSEVSMAQWQQTSGPGAGNVKAVLIDGNNYYAGAVGKGVYFSSDNCNSWVLKNNGLGSTNIFAFAQIGSNIFVGTTNGVYVSADNANNWTGASNGITSLYITCLYASGPDIYAGTNDGNLFYSANNGQAWSSIGTGLAGGKVNSVVKKDSILFAATDSYLKKSTNNGQSWTDCVFTTILPFNSLASDGINIYVATGSSVYKSSDNGNSWAAPSSSAGTTDFILFSGAALFKCGYGGLTYSTDSGSSYTSLNYTIGGCGKFAVNGNNILVSSSTFGIGFSSDFGANWAISNGGMVNSTVSSLISVDSIFLAGTKNLGVYSTANNGANWLSSNSGFGVSTNFGGFAKTGTHIFAVNDFWVYGSTNNGASWINLLSSSGGSYYSVAAVDSTIYAGYSSIVRISKDNGVTWNQPTNSGFPSFGPAIVSIALVDTIAFACQKSGTYPGVYKYNGINYWDQCNTGLTDTIVNCLASSGNYLYAGTQSGGFFFSTNYGASWTASNSGLLSQTVLSLFASGNNVFASTSSGVCYSNNNGSTWNSITTGLSGVTVGCFALSPSQLMAGSTNGKGVWKYPLTDFTSTSTNACTGDTVQFSGMSFAGGMGSWIWTFPGGTPATSTLQNPKVVFNSPGTYSVSLTAPNTIGTGTSITKNNYINIQSSVVVPACIPVSTLQNWPDGILNVTFNTINKTTQNANLDGGYKNFSCTEITTLAPGNSYPISVTLNSFGSYQNLRVYIDFDNDGILNSTNELVFSKNSVLGVQTGTINIPSNVVKYTVLRMRVLSNTSAIASSCTNPNVGQAEDYGVYIDPCPFMAATSTKTDVTCYNGNDGSATIIPTGGTTPYVYQWNIGQTTPTVTGLSSGNYTVTVTDVNGCIENSGITITQPDSISIASSHQNVCGPGNNNGSVTLSIFQGTAPFTFLWNTNPPQTGSSATGLEAGEYFATVTDANGCTSVSETDTIEEYPIPVAPVISASGPVTQCDGNSISLNSTSGDFYLWNNGDSLQNILVFSSGSFTVTVTYTNNCSNSSAPFFVNFYPAYQINQTKKICNGDSIFLQGNYQFSGGTYYDSLLSVNGCDSILETLLEVNPVPDISIVSTPDSGSANGTASANVLGGTAPFQFNWNNGETNQMIDSLSQGIYFVTVTDNNGCEGFDSVQVFLFTGISQNASHENGFYLFPNPNDGNFSIQINRNEMGRSGEIKIFNLLGEVEYSNSNIGNPSDRISISLLPGIYFIKLFTGGEVWVSKFSVIK